MKKNMKQAKPVVVVDKKEVVKSFVKGFTKGFVATTVIGVAALAGGVVIASLMESKEGE